MYLFTGVLKSHFSGPLEGLRLYRDKVNKEHSLSAFYFFKKNFVTGQGNK